MKIYLVDVSSLFFRAFYAIRPLTSPAGVPVNAVYGFLSMLVKLLREEKPEYVVFCYDRKEPSFRKDMYEDYKANRSEMPDDLVAQMPYLKRLPEVLGIPCLERAGFEADDLIGSMTKKARQLGMEVLIVSGDKDFGQLVGEGVTLFDTMKDVKYDAAAVKEKWGVWPPQMIDYLSLVGDTSDNIPGVAGIGPKGAIKLIEQLGTVEDIYANLDKVESKSVREKLEKSRDNAILSKKLVAIAMDVPLSDRLDDYHLKAMDREGLRALLQELNFKSFEKSLLESSEGSTFSQASGTAPVKSKKSEVPSSSVVAPVASTYEMSAAGDQSVRLITAWDLVDLLPDGASVWAWLQGDQTLIAQAAEIYSLAGEPKFLGPLIDGKKLRWSGFDLKTFWHHIGAAEGIPEWDAMLAAYAIEAGDRSDFEKVAQTWLGADLSALLTPHQMHSALLELRTRLQGAMIEKQAQEIYQTLDLPLVPILLKMEDRGIRIDKNQLSIQSQELKGEISVIEKEIHTLAGEIFNVGSPKQVGAVLFEKMGLESGRKTKTGFSTDNDVLEKLEHPIAQKILHWRELSKLKSTYVDALPALANGDDRVHTSFNQAVTATGRLSSTSPNLQNIPIRTERGHRVRRSFIAGPGLKLMSVDYSQIELRVLAHISEDPGLTKAFAQDLDIHAATAAEVFGVSLKDVTSSQRRTAKAVNFGIAYGQGVFGLSEALGIPRGEAQEIITRYFDKFKGVREYIESTTRQAHEKGYVETLFGRRRYITELQSKNPNLRKFGERAAINAPIQGTASDLVRKAMIEVAAQVPVDLLLQVHDELIFEGTEATLEMHSGKIREIMEGVMTLRVPLKVNSAIGDNWDQAH